MSAVNEAWRILGDPGRRVVYDRALAGPTSSAAPPSDHGHGSTRVPPRNRSGYNYHGDLAPARIPWRFMAVMATLGIGLVLLGAILFDGPREQQPDGIIRSGSCVEIESNNYVREVACTGQDDLVVDQLIPIDRRCPAGTSPHPDRLGLGLACVIVPGRS